MTLNSITPPPIQRCYHCDEPISQECQFHLEILGESRHLCCAGCEAVARLIVDNNLTNYYEHRTQTAQKSNIIPPNLQALQLYDHQDIQDDFVIENDQQHKQISLSVDGVSCAACAWLIEKQLKKQAGVITIEVNITTHRALLVWDAATVKLSDLLIIIHQLGYQAAPFEVDSQEQNYQQTMRHYLYKLGIAGIATMQIMMIAIALYFDVLDKHDNSFQNYLRWISLLIATPVLLYSALPFYRNAWRNIKTLSLGMDVPVSIALLFAYSASLYATITEQGEVFFESISMFTFFLLLGRFFEMRARRHAAAISANLLKLIPTMATLISGKKVAAKTLKKSDVVTILPGECLPADGIIVKGRTTINESMLTGESVAVQRTENDTVFAGTINVDGNISVRVMHDRKDSLISNIVRLQDHALYSKPQIALIADTVARYFVAAILVIALSTWLYWYIYRPQDALWITLAVLVATCPCALSLATPTAITCSTSSLGRLGLLVRRGHVLETLCKVNHVILDKTGTLTEGNVQLVTTKVFGQHSTADILMYAAELERYANHPIAKMFIPYQAKTALFDKVENVIGHGLSGTINQQQWRIGKYEFVSHNQSTHPPATNNQHLNDYSIWLSCNKRIIAAFKIEDPIRKDSKQLVNALKQQGMKVTMLTGDCSVNAQRVAQQLDIDHLQANMTPISKLNYLQKIPSTDISLMIGDGVNDAPVLAGAHLSIALSGGTDIAKSSADIVLLGDRLLPIIAARQLALRTRNIIHENLVWALGYNLIILPLAIIGLVAPYIAVIGMSTSSIIVVSNSLRLLK
ncbi:ATPase P [Photobacterium kishitanii]|uniref:P-type Cu(2+) transporter n=2 Tax=Photobacterium kishitanii TaxID=318456 RepID=A0AAX0YW87_9GAMM|nr:heavy metal translocating P-type ATPase [Photobacterium kishitanii]KJG58998.1 ATPase P [Photobacterium kishitanii]PSV04643.1 cadmium-translocating P-type ATPase [Photobacterium kishitanii]PSV77854.1 cadmium-translocating P-type ATPase [Photobacterium kishitanii]PSW50469.1 cadmium-translocating P-type ATPase [Photobacterium kishitanii]PSX20805.1 cadmium-translocating P-type ATPase [Photobacterium kishitanii]